MSPRDTLTTLSDSTIAKWALGVLTSIALGNEFTAVVNALISRPPVDRWLAGANYYWFFTAIMLVAAVIFIGVARGYRGHTYAPEAT